MFNATGAFLTQTLFELYIMVLLMRIFLQYYRANFYNPISQLVIKLTNPMVNPIKSYVPGFKGVDLSIVLLAYLLEVIKKLVLIKLAIGLWPPMTTLLVMAFFELVSDTLTFLFYMVILRVILSWIATPQAGALMEVVYLLSEPMLAPVRRLMPMVSGFDLSPLVVSIGLIAANTFIGSVIVSLI